MKFRQDNGFPGYRIHAYQAGQITIAASAGDSPDRRIFTRSLIITPDRVSDWPPQTLDELQVGHFELLLPLAPEVVLFGSGDRLRFPPAALLAPLAAQSIGMEVMNTQAACRTFNILASEGRRVAAALLMTRAT